MSTVMGTTSASNVIDVDVYARGEDGRGITSTTFQYQASNSPDTIPTGTWSDEFVIPEQGQYLWTKTTSTYSDESVLTSYNISYFSIDGGWYTPSVDEEGTLSWTPNKDSLPAVDSANIRGPQGLPGSVKFIYRATLPTENIETDAFYIIPAENPSSVKTYDEYFYINSGWEKLGDDLTAFYNKTQIQALLDDFIASTITVLEAEIDKKYYLTGVEQEGDENLHKTGITYHKAAAADKGDGFIDGDQITVNLFYSIS